MIQQLPSAPIWTGGAAVYPYSPGIEAALKFESNYEGEVSLTKKFGGVLLVPRRLAPTLGVDKRISRPVPAIDCKCPPLDEEQAGVIEKSLQLLQQEVDHVVEAPTGFGKTYVGSSVAARLGQVTLIVVTKQDLMDEWRRTLINLIGVPEDQIGIAQAAKLDYKGKRFVLAMVQSLIIPGKYDDDFFNAFGLILFDETHRMAAEKFSEACFLFPAKYRLGLSATPKRPDGKTPVITSHIGPVMVRGKTVPMKPKVLHRKTGWKIPPWIEKVNPGMLMPVCKAMANSKSRNEFIVKFIVSSYKAGRNLVVMGDMVDHLSKLQLMCGQAGIPGEDMGSYTGEVGKNKHVLKHNAQRRVIFATYGMCSEGTNYPQWDTLVMVTPRANILQPLGRILRYMPGKKQPVCLDLIDDNKVLQGFFYARLKQYHTVGATVVDMDKKV